VATCPWSRDDVGLIVNAMSHHVALDSSRSNQDHFPARRVTLKVLNITQGPCRVASVVEDDPRGRCECGLDVVNLLPLEADAIFILQARLKILHKLGGVDRDSGE
jgi:hypothetical protein